MERAHHFGITCSLEAALFEFKQSGESSLVEELADVGFTVSEDIIGLKDGR